MEGMWRMRNLQQQEDPTLTTTSLPYFRHFTGFSIIYFFMCVCVCVWGNGRGSLHVKTEECKDHRLYRAGTLPKDISIAFYLSSFHWFPFCFYNQLLRCLSKLLFVSMCVWKCSFFRITDKLLPFHLLSILIWNQLCMNLLCLCFSFNKLYLF